MSTSWSSSGDIYLLEVHLIYFMSTTQYTVKKLLFHKKFTPFYDPDSTLFPILVNFFSRHSFLIIKIPSYFSNIFLLIFFIHCHLLNHFKFFFRLILLFLALFPFYYYLNKHFSCSNSLNLNSSPFLLCSSRFFVL